MSTKVVAAPEQLQIDVGEIRLREIAELSLSFDPSEVDESYPFKIEVFRRKGNFASTQRGVHGLLPP